MRTLGPAVAEFFAANFKHIKGPLFGRSFVLEPWQLDDLNLMYEVDNMGRRVWRTIIYGLPRGNGKSPIAAGLGLMELVDREDAPEIFPFAAAREQAGIVHAFAHGMGKSGPLIDYLEFPRSRASAIKCPHNGGVMRVLSADGDLQHGLSVSVGVCDELHCFSTNKQEELYFAIVTATQKRAESLLLIITTAGANKASLLGEKFDAVIATHELEYLDDGCRLVARNRGTGSLMIWRGAPEDADVSDCKIWRKVNPASWIPTSEIERLAGEVPESVFRRLVLNQWVLGGAAAIQPASWDACCDKDMAIEDGSEVWLAVDVGERRDTSAVNILSPDGDKLKTHAIVFNPVKEHVKTLLPKLEATVRELAGRFTVRACAFDPWQFRRSAELLASDGIRMVEVPQIEKHMVPASQALFDLVEQQKLVHNGDPVLRRHVLAAEAKQTSRGTWRLAKPLQSAGRKVDESSKVDACIALAMAVAAYGYDTKAQSDFWAIQW